MLLITQGDERVHPRGAARGDEARDQLNRGKERG